jgi:hypothetical protein
MKRSIPVNKKVGRPKKKGGVHPVSAVRLAPEISIAVDDWASKQPDRPGRSEAIRRLVEIGLTVKKKSSPTNQMRADRASDLAAEALASLSVGAPDTAEQADRRRRLTKGPLEFREARVDLPKPKK